MATINGTPGSGDILTRMMKCWISFWTVLLALALGGQLQAARLGQEIGPLENGVPAWITVNDTEVHPTQLLARLKVLETDEEVRDLLGENEMEVKKAYSLVTGLLLIELKPNSGGIKHLSDYAKVLKAKLNLLKNSGKFSYVEYDANDHFDLTVDDSAFLDGILWGLNNQGGNGGSDDADIDAPEAWDITAGSTEIVVGVMDSGIRYTHQDLKERMWVNEDEIPSNGVDDDNDGYIDNIYGINGVTGSGDPMDNIGHGTHVAGTIAAAANDGNPHVGVAWNVRVIALKCGDFAISRSAQVAGVEFAVNEGIRVINGSFGGYSYSQTMFDTFQAGGDAGIIYSFSAGNDTNDNDQIPVYPAGYDLESIISVAATDRNDVIAGFSSYGKVSCDLAAPGLDIYSCGIAADDAYDTHVRDQHGGTARGRCDGLDAFLAAYVDGTPIARKNSGRSRSTAFAEGYYGHRRANQCIQGGGWDG